MFLYQRPYITAYNTVDTSLSGSYTQVTLGGIVASNYGFSVASNNIILPLNGTYAVGGQVNVVGASGYAIGQIQQNSTVFVTSLQTINTTATLASVPFPVRVIQGTTSDTIGLFALTSSSGSPTSQAGAATTFITVTFLGES